MNKPQAITLPKLRQDLKFIRSGNSVQGEPIWVIQDPITNRFYRLGWLEFEMLLHWHLPAQDIIDTINNDTPLYIDEGHLQAFVEFLSKNNLSQPTGAAIERLRKQTKVPSWQSPKWWLHNYLFFRIPIIKPQVWLQKAMPYVEPLFSTTALWLVIFASLLGLFLVTRQWDVFIHTLLDTLTPTGLIGFALAIIVSKILHELGHAFAATRYGLRVAHMGVAFLVLWPMLYTDTGESWKLQSHKQRLHISIAGITVELALAGIATLLWALLDDGALRQMLFYLATTSWVLTLALNTSPFLRFDGYYILSDIINFPNLHEQAGAHGRVWLRRNLLAMHDPWPSNLSAKHRHLLIGFAFLTWLYRLVVFLGIAILVYKLFFKLLGIFLMMVELVWFIIRPIWSEVHVWIKRWNEVPMQRRWFIWSLFGLIILLLTIPWKFDIDAQAVAHPEQLQKIYSPYPAQLAYIHKNQQQINKGDLLALFSNPDYLSRNERSQATAIALNQRLQGLIADREGFQQKRSLTEQLQEQLAEQTSIREEAGQLAIYAQFNGYWLDVDEDVALNTWVNNKDLLGVLINPQTWVVDAYVRQQDIDRLALGANAKFYDQAQGEYIAATVTAIDTTAVKQLPYLGLATRHGGKVATQEGHEQLLPVDALYRVRLALSKPLRMTQESYGEVHIEGQGYSLLYHGLQNALSVLIRESGF